MLSRCWEGAKSEPFTPSPPRRLSSRRSLRRVARTPSSSKRTRRVARPERVALPLVHGLGR